MKIKEFFKLMFRYIKDHIKAVLLAGLFTIVFIFVFYLYRVDSEPVLYALLICGIISLAFLIHDFIKFCTAHLALQKVQASEALDLFDFPKGQNLIEEDYLRVIEALCNEKNQLLSLNDKQIIDMMDYYTLWVHQIKTPISAMSLLLQVEEHPRRSELENELFKIEQYVEMVLAYLRLSSNSSDYVIKDCDLDSIIKQLIKKFTPLFIKGRIKLNYRPLQQTILTDEKWFFYGVEQLLSNALKYTHSGEISIYTENNKLIISDTGIGIAPSDLPRIFEKGFTGYNGRLDRKASGLGLYLCKRILNNLSHSLEIQSIPKKGTKAFVGLDRIELHVE